MKEQLQDLLIKSLGDLIEKGLLTELPSKIRLDHTKDKTHGDYATNVALVLAKQTKSDPKKLAQTIVDQLGESELVKKTEIAGPGFINFSFLMNQAVLWLMTLLIVVTVMVCRLLAREKMCSWNLFQQIRQDHFM